MKSLDAVRPHLVGEVFWEGRTGQVFVHSIEHESGTVLVDTGWFGEHPDIEEFRPVVLDWPELGEVVAVINTHLHFDHCGGNRRYPGVPIFVQRAELDAIDQPGFTVPEWVRFDGASYVELDGEAEVLPGIRVLPVPGHSPGQQAVVVDTDEGRVVVGGDVTYRLRDFDESDDPNIRRILALEPRRVWISHAPRAWEPRVG